MPLCSVVVVLASCTTVMTLQGNPTFFLATHHPYSVTVTLRNGSKLDLDMPHVERDTLFGMVRGEYRDVRLSELVQMRMRQPARGKTVALVAGLTVVGAVATVLVLMGDNTSE